MASASVMAFSVHAHTSVNSDIEFVVEGNSLDVGIETARLAIRSVEAEDISSYAELFGDSDVMRKYATGETKTREEIQARVQNLWIKRWREKDPFSALAVFNKSTDEFIGHVVLGHGDRPGQAEIAYLFKKNCWRQGFGSETVTAVVRDYAPAIVREGYLLEGCPLEEITATARPDNPASVRILEKVRMHQVGESERFGALRYHFSINVSEI